MIAKARIPPRTDDRADERRRITMRAEATAGLLKRPLREPTSRANFWRRCATATPFTRSRSCRTWEFSRRFGTKSRRWLIGAIGSSTKRLKPRSIPTKLINPHAADFFGGPLNFHSIGYLIALKYGESIPSSQDWTLMGQKLYDAFFDEDTALAAR